MFFAGRNNFKKFCLGLQTLAKRRARFFSLPPRWIQNFIRFLFRVRRDRYTHQMAGPTVYHGVAQKVYLVKEAVIGMSLGLVAGAVWKYSHWERRKEIQSYYDKKSSK